MFLLGLTLYFYIFRFIFGYWTSTFFYLQPNLKKKYINYPFFKALYINSVLKFVFQRYLVDGVALIQLNYCEPIFIFAELFIVLLVILMLL